MEIIILHSEDEKTMEKVIFLDRDGTLNAEVNYLHRPEDLQLIPGVPEALRRLKEAGYKLSFMISYNLWLPIITVSRTI